MNCGIGVKLFVTLSRTSISYYVLKNIIYRLQLKVLLQKLNGYVVIKIIIEASSQKQATGATKCLNYG